jgi:hypothetical protein
MCNAISPPLKNSGRKCLEDSKYDPFCLSPKKRVDLHYWIRYLVSHSYHTSILQRVGFNFKQEIIFWLWYSLRLVLNIRFLMYFSQLKHKWWGTLVIKLIFFVQSLNTCLQFTCTTDLDVCLKFVHCHIIKTGVKSIYATCLCYCSFLGDIIQLFKAL